MSGKRNLARENQIRRLMTKRKNADKVMIGYIKTLHPAIYAEADKYLQNLTKEYPDKKDLSKTNGFQYLLKNKLVKMGNFQLRIKLKDYRKASDPAAEVTTPNLLAEVTTADPAAEVTTPNSLAEVTTADPAAEVTTPNSLAEVTTADPAAEVTTPNSPAEVTTANSLAEMTTPDPQDATLPLMSEETLEAIMADLREDPDIANFLNNLEYELDDCPLW